MIIGNVTAHYLTGTLQNHFGDSRSGRHGGYSLGRVGGLALLAVPAEQCPEGLSVARAHGVVDREVEGGVGVGDDVEQPQTRHEKVVVTSPCVHLWHEGQDEPAGHTHTKQKE